MERTSDPKHLVAIAGSSGSLQPLTMIVGALTPDLDAATVVVIHRGAARQSYLTQILSRKTCAPVVNAHDGAILRRGWVYVTPPGDRHISLDGRVIRLLPGPRINFQRPAGDPLFESAARSFGSRAIGVVLSGMGRNGEAGIAAIKRAGGRAYVQLPSEAQEPSMPEHALEVVEPDLCAPAAVIARRLVALCGPPDRQREVPAAEPSLQEAQWLQPAANDAQE